MKNRISFLIILSLLALIVLAFSACGETPQGTDTGMSNENTTNTENEKPNHTHAWMVVPGKEPTCTQEGYTESEVCVVCGEFKVMQEVIPSGHKEETIAQVLPNCTETGLTEGKKCSVCGEITVAQESIDALGHKEEIIEAVPPVYAGSGLTEGKKCTVCGEITTAQEIIEPLENKYEYDMSKYITIPDFQNYVIDVELDALQAAIDSYIIYAASEYVVSRGDDIYVNITVYEELSIESSNGDVIKKKGDKIDSLSHANYLIENLGSSPLPYKLETDIINAELNLKDVITRKYAYSDLEGYAPAEYEGQNLYFEVKILNKVTELGDIVNVKYEAYLVDEDNSIILDENGKETPFDKGDSSTFFLGSKLAIDDFENGLTGILLYEEHSFYATFPDDYIDEEYQNKKALFRVTPNAIYKAPIYNNDFIKKMFPDFITITEFEAQLKKEYIKEKMYDYLFDNVTIHDYPKAEYNKIKKDIEESAPSFKEYYGITFDEYIKEQGFKTRDEYIKSNMKTEMIYYTISKTLGLKPNDAQIENEKQSLITYYKALYMEQQGLDGTTALSTAETFVQNLGEIYIYENVMYNLVELALFDNAKSNEIERTYESISEVLARDAAGKTE